MAEASINDRGVAVTDRGVAQQRTGLASVCVVVPVCNEELVLSGNIRKLTAYLEEHIPNPWEVVIAENGSTDGTLELARGVAVECEHVRVISTGAAGRGRALREAWMGSEADILAYMDADLSTELEAVGELIGVLDGASGAMGTSLPYRFDLSIGSRLMNPAGTTRCFKREVMSRGYNFLVRRVLGASVRDAQGGFKAITRRAARHLLPLVKDDNWFFDTELLVLAQWHGYRIHEFAVKWEERRETHVRVWRTVVEDLKGIWRMRSADG